MNNITKELHEPCLNKFGFYLDENFYDYNKEGSCYTLNSNIGKGHYWMYAENNLFSISILDCIFHEDFYLEYDEPNYLGISYYDSICAEEICDDVCDKDCCSNSALVPNCLRIHHGNNLFKAIYHKNIPVKYISIEVCPKYYEEYLSYKYNYDLKNLPHILLKLNGLSNFPEIVFLLHQLKSYSGTGLPAKMYFNGKIIEAISLLLEKSKCLESKICKKNLCDEDLKRLSLTCDYIDNNFSSNISQEQLTKIACMGTTKLKYCFKKTYNSTITEYIQNKRIVYAENLLTNTALNINEISSIVGYSSQGHFSKLFYRKTGMLPSEYRKLSFVNLS